MKIGIMGGTFDPIHNGHLMLGKEALAQFRLDEIWYMPNGNPPHKSQRSIQSDAKHRAAMTRLAIQKEARFRLETYEVERETISYTYETLRHFHETYAEHVFYFIIGADSLYAIEDWVHPEEIFRSCTILAAFRDHVDTPEKIEKQIRYLKEKYGADIRLLNTPLMDVSSKELRSRMREGRSVSAYVPDAVERYIREEKLYGTENT